MGARLGFDEFLRRIDKTDTCWIWKGTVLQNGYGRFSQVYAHRLSYEAFVGPIPEGLEIDHLCRVRNCVNPKHLEPVTGAENKRRASAARSARPAASRWLIGPMPAPARHRRAVAAAAAATAAREASHAAHKARVRALLFGGAA